MLPAVFLFHEYSVQWKKRSYCSGTNGRHLKKKKNMSVLCSLPYYALSPYLLRCLFVLSISIGKTSRIMFVLYVASALLKCNNKQKIYMQVNHPKSEKRHIRNKSYSSKHFLSKICKSLIQYWCSRILSPKLILARPKGGAAQTNLLR